MKPGLISSGHGADAQESAAHARFAEEGLVFQCTREWLLKCTTCGDFREDDT